MIRDWGEV